MKNKKIILFFLLLILAVASIIIITFNRFPKNEATQSLTKDDKALTLESVEYANPALDLQNALDKNDYRFIGTMGFALMVPGVENYYEKYEKQYGIKIIEGTSDVIENPRLQNIAYEYAKKYNTLLLEKINEK